MFLKNADKPGEYLSNGVALRDVGSVDFYYEMSLVSSFEVNKPLSQKIDYSK